MKKILSTVLVGALIAGIAFAEVSFNYKGTAILGNTSKNIGKGYVYRTDAFTVGAKNDVAGVEFEADLTPGDYDEYVKAQTATKFNVDHFYGYLTFGLPVGNLQITSGRWDARWVNRVKGDGGELDGRYYEAYKPGVMGGKIAKDINNLTGSSNYATVLAYTLNDVLPGSLMFKFGIVALNKDPLGLGTKYNEGSNDNTTISSGFVGQIAYQQDDLIKVNVDFKTLKQNAYAFGIFLSPLMIENLQATVGFSMGLYNVGDKAAAEGKEPETAKYEYTEWGVDLRLRYAITEKWSVTTMHNISSYKLTPNDKYTGTEKEKDTKAMWNMLSVAYKAGDNIRFLATVANKNTDWKASNPTANTFSITPACEIKVNEKAKFTAAFDIRWDKAEPYGGTGTITLPIYFNFSL